MSEQALKREYSQDLRRKYASQGVSLPDGSYPIPDKGALMDAVHSFGRANPSDRAKVRRHIIKRARALGAMDLLPPDWPGSTQEKKGVDTLILFGGMVKTLGHGKVGGYLVQYGDATKTDLVGDFFTDQTDFDVEFPARTSVYYNHALDADLKGRKLGKGEMSADPVGIWVEAQLAMRDDYEKMIYKMADEGRLGWSSGTASHLVERKAAGAASQILAWPLGLDASLTPTPCEPRNAAISLKSWSAEMAIDDDEEESHASPDAFMTERSFEKLLTGSGFSKREARVIITDGFKALSRWDADETEPLDTDQRFQTRLKDLEARLRTGVPLNANLTAVSAQSAGTGD